MPMTFFCPHCTSFGFATGGLDILDLNFARTVHLAWHFTRLSGVTHPREAVASHRRTGWL